MCSWNSAIAGVLCGVRGCVLGTPLVLLVNVLDSKWNQCCVVTSKLIQSYACGYTGSGNVKHCECTCVCMLYINHFLYCISHACTCVMHGSMFL